MKDRVRIYGFWGLVAFGLVLFSAASARADLVAFEPFAFSSESLDGVGSGIGWSGDWTGAPGGASSERLLQQEFSLSAYPVPYYISFLARKDEEGTFQVESSRSDGTSRWRVRVGADGRVGAGIDVWAESEPGFFEAGATYLIVSKFVPGSLEETHVAGTTGRVYVKVFESGVDTLPDTDAALAWDVSLERPTHVSQDRFRIGVDAGHVELDEFRFGTSWEAVVLGDGTGTFESWRSRYFSQAELDDPTISDPGATPAKDGVPNLLKYAFFDLEPREPASWQELPRAGLVDGELQLVYTERENVRDIEYIAEVSNDLIEWRSDALRIREIGRTVDSFGEQVTVAALPPPRVTVFEPFDFPGSGLNGGGSGTGWSGDWFAMAGGGLGLVAGDGTLVYPAGSFLIPDGFQAGTGAGEVASARFLEAPLRFSSGSQPIYFSFLARKRSAGSFRVESVRSDGISRWGVDVLPDGTVGVRVVNWVESAAGLFKGDTAYLMVSKLVPGRAGSANASAQVKLYEVGVDSIPMDDTEVRWDIVSRGDTGVSQDQIALRVFGGQVELDELRIGDTWQAAVLENAVEVDRKFMRMRVRLLEDEPGNSSNDTGGRPQS